MSFDKQHVMGAAAEASEPALSASPTEPLCVSSASGDGQAHGLAGTPITPSANLALWLSKVASGEWSWVRNTRCKYVTLRIDTRRGAYALLDRDEKPITQAELEWQYGSGNRP